MPETFTIPVTKTTKTTEQVEPSLFQLALEWGTPSTAARATTLLRARDATGEWDKSVEPLRAVIEDERNAEGELVEPRVCTNVNNLILDAVIPADDPRAVALGVGGMTVRQMGEMLVEQQLQEQV